MNENCPSRTALRVATQRAEHQVLDDPRIFDDPLALRILGLNSETVRMLMQEQRDETPYSHILRASLAARSRYAEDALSLAIQQGISQYVVLGAGLDTFAYRNPYPDTVLRVFEVDHPATQDWKRKRLAETGISIPQTLSFIPVDFEKQTLADGLHQAGFDISKRSLFAWLGVTMYLSQAAIDTTLRLVALLPAGSRIVFDYLVSPTLLSSPAHLAFEQLSASVRLAGEPFQTCFAPSDLSQHLLTLGFAQAEDIGPDELDARYLRGRTDKLRVGRLAHIMNARV